MGVSKAIPVVFITDDNYVMPTAVAITSLIANKSVNTVYKIFILTESLSPEHTEKLTALNTEDASVSIIEVDSEPIESVGKSNVYENIHVSKASLFKFRIPELFEDYDRILYLDGDLVVKKGLSEFFNRDISEVYAAVVKDMIPMLAQWTKHTNLLKINHSSYFSSGVMLLNLDKMRKDRITEKLIEYRKNGINYLMDQDAFNVVFSENVIYADYSYNLTYTSYVTFPYKHLKDFYNFEYKNKDEILEEAAIIHFCGKKKPWMQEGTQASEIWDEYYTESPFGDIELNREVFSNELSVFDKAEQKFMKFVGRYSDSVPAKFIGLYGKMRHKF